MKATGIRIVIGALGMNPKDSLSRLEDLETGTKRDNLKYIIKIDQNTEKSSRDLLLLGPQ